MLCHECQENEATVHLKKLVGNRVEHVNLCAECASAHGLTEAAGRDLAKLVFSLTSGCLRKKDDQHDASARFATADSTFEGETLVCPDCGLTTQGFSQTGRFGCAACYATFATVLQHVLGAVQKSPLHKGKCPHKPEEEPEQQGTGMPERLVRLREALMRAVVTESYEDAAKLRDEIRRLESDLD